MQRGEESALVAGSHDPRARHEEKQEARAELPSLMQLTTLQRLPPGVPQREVVFGVGSKGIEAVVGWSDGDRERAKASENDRLKQTRTNRTPKKRCGGNGRRVGKPSRRSKEVKQGEKERQREGIQGVAKCAGKPTTLLPTAGYLFGERPNDDFCRPRLVTRASSKLHEILRNERLSQREASPGDLANFYVNTVEVLSCIYPLREDRDFWVDLSLLFTKRIVNVGG
ncbi:hypothetical protein K0M31_013805 [Melipona bicolor]|uniref:Uncharacterized protein n=1 Tax=Melipona bicolor TaxID=60889 RepID=A0AA40FHF2_9HYME|nr:hypothetical protein K0M31_013805 [Melipona bicolor]